MSPGRSRDKVACPLCHTQGELPAEACVQSSCSCSVAPGDPKASGRHSICFQCQSSRAGKSCEAQSPQFLPQCPRHMKQVQLLFCEDHREPICLICRLSQEHQGHRVRPIEEAALQYKVRCSLPGPISPWELDTGLCVLYPTPLGCGCISQDSWAVNDQNKINWDSKEGRNPSPTPRPQSLAFNCSSPRFNCSSPRLGSAASSRVFPLELIQAKNGKSQVRAP